MISITAGITVHAEQTQGRHRADREAAEQALADYLRARGPAGILAARVAATFWSWDGRTRRLIMPGDRDATPAEAAAWDLWQEAERIADAAARAGWANPNGETGIVYGADLGPEAGGPSMPSFDPET